MAARTLVRNSSHGQGSCHPVERQWNVSRSMHAYRKLKIANSSRAKVGYEAQRPGSWCASDSWKTHLANTCSCALRERGLSELRN